jgi:hypothetical protein
MMNIIMATNNMAIVSELMKHLVSLYHNYAQRNISDKQIIL